MDRREIILAIRDYTDSLPEDERFCNGCWSLKVKRLSGATGQQMRAFNDGTARCDDHELMWALSGPKVHRPIECILNGIKHKKE